LVTMIPSKYQTSIIYIAYDVPTVAHVCIFTDENIPGTGDVGIKNNLKVASKRVKSLSTKSRGGPTCVPYHQIYCMSRIIDAVKDSQMMN